MPAKSKAQFRLMQGIAHGSIAPKGTLTPAKAAEYVAGQSPKGLPKRVKVRKADDGAVTGDDYVDAPTGSLRAKLEAQRQGRSQYGAIPAAIAKDPVGAAELLAAAFVPAGVLPRGAGIAKGITAEGDTLRTISRVANPAMEPLFQGLNGLGALLKLAREAGEARVPKAESGMLVGGLTRGVGIRGTTGEGGSSAYGSSARIGPSNRGGGIRSASGEGGGTDGGFATLNSTDLLNKAFSPEYRNFLRDTQVIGLKDGGTVATRTIPATKKGQKPIKFHEGGLHESTGTPAGEKIPAAKHAAAAAGKLGPKAKAQENFYRNVLHGADDGATTGDENKVKKFVESVEEGPGKVGEAVVEGLKKVGEVPSKAQRAVENVGKKAKKVLGLQDGGVTGMSMGGFVTRKRSRPGSRGMMGKRMPMKGAMMADGGTVPEGSKSGAYIRAGLNAMRGK